MESLYKLKTILKQISSIDNTQFLLYKIENNINEINQLLFDILKCKEIKWTTELSFIENHNVFTIKTVVLDLLSDNRFENKDVMIYSLRLKDDNLYLRQTIIN